MNDGAIKYLLLALAMLCADVRAQEVERTVDDGQTWQQGSRPVPDPTVLTSQALQREVAGLKELFETRLDAMDKAITLLQSRADQSPSIDVVSESVISLRKLFIEKFRRVDTQISERDTRTEQTATESSKAIAAALQAAKEAVSEQNKSNAASMEKTEMALTKQLDQQQVLMRQTTEALESQVDDLKERINLAEGRTRGIGDGWGYIVGAVGAMIALAALIMQLTSKRQAPQ